MVSGFQLITARMLDARRTFVVGASLSLGLGVQMAPELYHGLVPQAMESGLTITAVAALLLNLCARIGISETATLSIPLGVDATTRVASDLEILGGKWGARRDVIARVVGSLIELTELLAQRNIDAYRIDLTFDEFSLRVIATFPGPALPLPENRPAESLLLEDDAGLALFSGYLMRSYCKKIDQRTANGETILDMRFSH
jgi:NCS2 family nucleobase:cation symporter-2